MTAKSARIRHFASDNYSGSAPKHSPRWRKPTNSTRSAMAMTGGQKRHQTSFARYSRLTARCFLFSMAPPPIRYPLASMCQSYHSVLCHELAHVEVAECGAPEFFANGSKVLLLHGDHAKVDGKSIERAVNKRTDIHYPKPRVLSLTQPTEMGTVYSLDELKALTDLARHLHLRVHVDGSRFANAVVSLGVTPKEISWKAGVDVLCLAEPRTGLPLAKPSSSSIANWQKNLTIAANRADNSRQKCGISRPHGSEFAGWSVVTTCGPFKRNGQASGICDSKNPECEYRASSSNKRGLCDHPRQNGEWHV